VCGILGIKLFNRLPEKSDRNFVHDAIDAQRHRGPDAQEVAVVGKCVLGHNRLAIVDLNERSNQPFFDSSGRYALVFNGEIYNYPELKNELLRKGYEFNTASDTEVLLYYLVEHGTEGIKELNGCFAFAFYDKQEDELILVRDPLGINPLLFSIDEERICFGSEMFPFYTWMPNATISLDAINYYFKYTYIPAPLTILQNVQKLLPGHYLKVNGRFYDMVRYFNPSAEQIFQGTYDEAKVILKEKVEHAVITRLEADVPVGTFLSGGVDSSIVSAIASRFKDGLQTYSVGFSDRKFYDESAYASRVAEHIHSLHTPITLSDNEAVSRLKEILESYDEPFADSSSIAMFFLSEGARKNVTVCLSGDGADELFAGYNKHKAFNKVKSSGLLVKVARSLPKMSQGHRSSKWKNKLRQFGKLQQLSALNWPDNYWFLAGFSDGKRRESILKNFADVKGQHIGVGELNDMLLMDQLFVLPNDMLKKVDLMSMRHSLEVRVPFLDKDVVKFANSLPGSYKIRNGVTKSILRDAFRDVLPSEVFDRSKKGFEVPLRDWILAAWNEIFTPDMESEQFLLKQGFFRPKGIQDLINRFKAYENAEDTTLIWAYIVFQYWYLNHKLV
jgi:asparagine synthase (glutamine-hydrolysing)